MQFANKAVSLFISGFFCLVWILLLALSLDDYLIYKSFKNLKIIKETAGLGLIGFTFLVFPLAYALGNAVNAVVNRLFGKMDKRIRWEVFREKVFTGDANLADINGLLNDIGENNSLTKDDYIKMIGQPGEKPGEDLLKKIQETYHHYRFKIYKSSTDLYNHLIFHREIIRVLRATCFNFLMIFFALLTVPKSPALKIAGYSFTAIFLMYILLIPEYFSRLDFSGICLSNTSRVVFILSFFIGTAILFILFPNNSQLFMAIFPFTIFISLICLIAWKKQQEDFYRSIISAIKVK
jgi:hypothetical protein